MITLIVLLKRKPGLSKEQFKAHYESNHVALAKKHVGHLFHDYRRHYVNSSTFVGADGHSLVESQDGTYDCITNITFSDQSALAEFGRIMNVPDVKAAFEADEEKFMHHAAQCFYMCDGVRT